jgi:signal transduction histidine kinase
MLDRLQAAFAAQQRFVANAAHELKTPVTHLLGQAQVLARQARSPEEYDRFVSGGAGGDAASWRPSWRACYSWRGRMPGCLSIRGHAFPSMKS